MYLRAVYWGGDLSWELPVVLLRVDGMKERARPRSLGFVVRYFLLGKDKGGVCTLLHMRRGGVGLLLFQSVTRETSGIS